MMHDDEFVSLLSLCNILSDALSSPIMIIINALMQCKMFKTSNNIKVLE